jgi:hypothetical protein
MHRVVVYDSNKRKYNLHNTFYFYTLHWWDVKIYKFCSCLFYDVKFFGTHQNLPRDKNRTAPFTNITSCKTHTPL